MELGGLWDGRGDKPRWQAGLGLFGAVLRAGLAPTTVNNWQLEQERQVSDRIRRLMKKGAGDGNAPATATNTNDPLPKPSSKQTLTR